MFVANQELCKELYELSGWGYDCEFHYLHREIFNRQPRQSDLKDGITEEDYAPAYDLGYLLRKLPPTIPSDGADWMLQMQRGSGGWFFAYGVDWLESEGDTPEDAACKLAIELIKSGVLQGGGKDE